MNRKIAYSPSARGQLSDLYVWLAKESGSPEQANNYISAILDYCDALADFPMVGSARSDLRPGLRTIGFRRRAVIAFAVDENAITVHGVYYGGQDYEPPLAAEPD